MVNTGNEPNDIEGLNKGDLKKVKDLDSENAFFPLKEKKGR